MPRTATPPAATPAAALAPDLTEGLKRLKLATVRRLAPDVLATAKVQRWAPEEVLRTLIEAEIAARDESNKVTRLKTANFPVAELLDEFKVTPSSVPQPPSDHLAALDWLRAAPNLYLAGPPGTGRTHLLIAL